MQRRSKRVLQSPSVLSANAIKGSSLEHENEQLYIKYISAYKGHGVFARKKIEKGAFIAEYRGEKVSYKEGEKRMQGPSSVGSFLFFIGKKTCIDASYHEGKGKMINDSITRKQANCNPKMIDGHLCIFAVRDIEAGEELLYYYGETDCNMYWRLGQKPELYFSPDGEPEASVQNPHTQEDSGEPESFVQNPHSQDPSSTSVTNSQTTPLIDQAPIAQSIQSVLQPSVMLSDDDSGEPEAIVQNLHPQDTSSTSVTNSQTTPLIDQAPIAQSIQSVLQPSEMLSGDDSGEPESFVQNPHSQDPSSTSLINSQFTPLIDQAPSAQSMQLVLQPSEMLSGDGSGEPEAIVQNLHPQDTSSTSVMNSQTTPLIDQAPIAQSMQSVLQPSEMLSGDDSGEPVSFVQNPYSQDPSSTSVMNSQTTPLIDQAPIAQPMQSVLQPSEMLSGDGSGEPVSFVQNPHSQDPSSTSLINFQTTPLIDQAPIAQSMQSVLQPSEMLSGDDSGEPESFVQNPHSQDPSSTSLINSQFTPLIDQAPSAQSMQLVLQPSEMLSGDGSGEPVSFVQNPHSQDPSSTSLINFQTTPLIDQAPIAQSMQSVLQPSEMLSGDDSGEPVSFVQNPYSQDPSSTSLINSQFTPLIDQAPSAQSMQLVLQPSEMLSGDDSGEPVSFVQNPYSQDPSSTSLINSQFTPLIDQAPSAQSMQLVLQPSEMLSGDGSGEPEAIVQNLHPQDPSSTSLINSQITPLIDQAPSAQPMQSALQPSGVLSGDDDVDMVEDSASDISNIIPCFPSLCQVDNSDTEIDDSDNDPDYKPDSDVSLESDSRDTELSNLDSLVGNQVEIQSHHVSSSISDTKSTIAVEQRRATLGKGQRDWSRKHTCFICDERVCDIPRHVIAKHPKEKLVEEALSKPKGSKERRTIWRIIANKGTFKHNMKVKDIGGELHVFKRSSSSRKPEEYKACPHCCGYFLKNQLWRHGKKCQASIFLGSGKNVVQASISSISTVMESAASSTKYAEQLFENFLDKMRKKDEIFILVKNDVLLSTYAKSLLEEGKGHSDTSWTVRLMAKLLISIRGLSKCETYSWMTLINTEHWNEIVNGVKTLGEFKYCNTESEIVVEKPNIALKCGQGVKGLIAAAEGIALRQNNDVLLKQVENMFKMYDREWAKTSKHCMRSIKTKKEDQVDLLPLTSDITKLKEKTVNEMNRLVSEIRVEPTREKYLMLSKLTISRLITFNARRGGEPSKLRTINWQNIREGSSVHQEELDALPIEEKKLAERLKLGYVKGKGARSKKVPIIFPEETVVAIDVLMQHRESFITNKSNPYVFARLYKNSVLPLRGSDCVREVCEMAGLQRASLVTATQMRKYLATTLQLLDMQESELRWVTDHLGHTVDVHKKWYRLSNRAVELTKVASILSASESGHLQKAHNVQFDNVNKDAGEPESFVQNPHSQDPSSTSLINSQITPLIDQAPSAQSMQSALQPSGMLSGDDPGEPESFVQNPHSQDPSSTSLINSQITPLIDQAPSAQSMQSVLQPSGMLSGKGKKKQVHLPWSLEERKALYSAFGCYLNGTRRGLPGKGEICTAQTKHKILRNRSWLNIKYQLKNMLKK